MWRSIAGPVLLSLTLTTATGGEPVSPSEPSASTVLDNPFFPDDTTVNVTDCVSALPRPNCESEAREDWRQWAVFGAVAAGLAAVGVRLVMAVRRR